MVGISIPGPARQAKSQYGFTALMSCILHGTCPETCIQAGCWGDCWVLHNTCKKKKVLKNKSILSTITACVTCVPMALTIKSSHLHLMWWGWLDAGMVYVADLSHKRGPTHSFSQRSQRVHVSPHELGYLHSVSRGAKDNRNGLQPAIQMPLLHSLKRLFIYYLSPFWPSFPIFFWMKFPLWEGKGQEDLFLSRKPTTFSTWGISLGQRWGMRIIPDPCVWKQHLRR